MRLCNTLIRYLFVISFCYGHDLNHIDPVAVKQSEAPISKNIETTTVQKNDEAVGASLQAPQNLDKPSVRESDPNNEQGHKQQVQSATPSKDSSLPNQVPVSNPNDLTSSSSTPVPTPAKQSSNIPISNSNPQPKVPTPLDLQPVDTIQQKNVNEDTLVIPKQILSSTQSQQTEQIKLKSEHIPSPVDTPQPISNGKQDSNLPDTKSDQLSQVPLKPTETVANDTSIGQSESHIPISTSAQVLRSATPKFQPRVQVPARQDPVATEDVRQKDAVQVDNTVVKEFTNVHKHSIESPSKSEQPQVETTPRPVTIPPMENKSQIQVNDPNLKPINNVDLPRQVRVHHSTTLVNQQDASNVSSTQEDFVKNENLTTSNEIENATTITSTAIPDANAHLPRTLKNDEKPVLSNSTTTTNNSQTNETNLNLTQIELKIEDSTNSTVFKSSPALNSTSNLSTDKNRHICWHLPKTFESSIGLLENQIFRLINILPDFIQTIFFGRIDDREVLMNTMWLGSVCTMCVLFSFFFLSMGTKRLKQSKNEKEVRARCQQLQQYNNQIELERATFERQNQKLSDELDECKSVPVRDIDEDIFALREECTRFQDDLKTARAERDTLQQNVDHKQSLIQKHEYDMQRQVETVAYLNNEILQLKQQLEKERALVGRLQSNDITLERFEKSQEMIQELKSEITQLKQDKFSQKDQLQETHVHANQLDVEKNQLILRMKQLKDLLEQRDRTIKRIQEKINEDEPQEFEDLLSIIKENSSTANQHLLSTIDDDLNKSNQHIRDLHTEIDEKTRRIKELDLLFKQEKDRCREMETKLKVVLELRERDAHLHIRQLGQTDAELRKARTDTERVRILQQQLDLKQKQLDDVQKVLSTEQTKFNEECSKLQHETHEKWMEVKRVTRELDVSKKECENLRKQITRYASNERSSQEKTMIKPVPQHFGNNGELEMNGSSPNSYQQRENFIPIDHQRNDSGATSPTQMFMSRPPLYGLPRPPFFPPSFMPHHPSNAYIMHPRFPMPTTSPHGMISPISHLMINGNDANISGMIDSSNITPNSTSYDAQSNGGALSPVPENEKQVKTKKTKKSSKKKTETSLVKENV